MQGLRFARRPVSFALAAQRRLGDVWQPRVPTRAEAFTVTGHPDHTSQRSISCSATSAIIAR